MSTGYSSVRAEQHDIWIPQIVDMLNHRGYPAWACEPNGDAPDIRFRQPTGETAFIDAKCPAGANYAIKMGAVHLALASPHVTLFLTRSDNRLHTVVSLLPRLMGGPRRPTGNGSRTDWYLFANGGGVAFNDYFPERAVAS